MPRHLTEQRHAARTGGKFAEMKACDVCGRRGTLEPAFGGDSSRGAEHTKWWNKLICSRCASEASKHLTKSRVQEMVATLRKSFEEMAETMDPAIRSSLEGHPDKEARDSLARAIYHDTLVPGVGNKRAYRDFLSRPRGGVHVSLDLNDFKAINDQLSYQHGDDAIAAAGKAFSEASRANRGKLFRPGGDEFRAHFDTPEQAYSFLRRAQQNFSGLQPVGGVHRLSFSAGLGEDQGRADEAAHRAKAAKTAMFGSVRAGGAKVGHGRHFVYSALPGAVGPVQVEESPAVPPGLKRPTQPMPLPEPFYEK